MTDALLARAEAYPFDLQSEPFGWRSGMIEPFDPSQCARLQPMLAIGSNAAPEALARKLGEDRADVLVAPAILHDHAVVFAAHITAYGSLPATLIPHPGAKAQVALIWAEPEVHHRLGATEALGRNYAVQRLQEAIACEAAPAPAVVDAFVSLTGALLLNGKPLRLAEVPTVRTTLPALHQPAALRLVHRHLGGGLPFAPFIEGAIACADRRAELRRYLAAGLSTNAD